MQRGTFPGSRRGSLRFRHRRIACTAGQKSCRHRGTHNHGNHSLSFAHNPSPFDFFLEWSPFYSTGDNSFYNVFLHENEEPCQRIAALTGFCEELLQENDIYLSCVKLLILRFPLLRENLIQETGHFTHAMPSKDQSSLPCWRMHVGRFAARYPRSSLPHGRT